MNKKHDLLAKYFATLSQIVFGVVVIRQFTEHFNVLELAIGLCIVVLLVIVAYIIQPKE
ncbi:MAG: hypothetical protein HY279_00525 [Nitrospinae bacterium]|nr:hypothetical protein [Nitrospinota bacterium]